MSALTVGLGATVHYHWAGPIERVLTADDYAVILQPDGEGCGEPGCVDDIAWNRDTTESRILEGATALAVDPENQALLDIWRAQYVDCWGAA